MGIPVSQKGIIQEPGASLFRFLKVRSFWLSGSSPFLLLFSLKRNVLTWGSELISVTARNFPLLQCKEVRAPCWSCSHVQAESLWDVSQGREWISLTRGSRGIAVVMGNNASWPSPALACVAVAYEVDRRVSAGCQGKSSKG